MITAEWRLRTHSAYHDSESVIDVNAETLAEEGSSIGSREAENYVHA